MVEYDTSRVEKCVKDCFRAYHFSYEDFLSELKDDDDFIEKASEALGVKPESLINSDYDEAQKRLCHYPYFGLKDLFDEAYRQRNDKSFDEIFEEIDSGGQNILYRIYDDEDVKNRLLAAIDQGANNLPEIKHKGANISWLHIKTETMFEFDRFKDLATSYLEMYDIFEKLFFKAWESDLPEDEIREYNFLVSFFGIQDLAYPRPLYYNLLKIFIPQYKEEGYNDVLMYVKTGRRATPMPTLWKCANFVDYPELVTKFVNIYPKAKSEMHQQVMLCKNFKCSYVWSDEEIPDIDPEDEEYLLNLLKGFGDEQESKYHIWYVPKVENEFRGFGNVIGNLSKMARIESRGGIPMPSRKLDLSVQRTIRRTDAELKARRSQ